MKILAVCYYAPPTLTPQAIQIGRQLYHLDAQVTLVHGDDDEFPGDYDQYPDFYRRIESLGVPDPGPVLTGLAHRVARRVLPFYGTTPDGLGSWRRKARPAALAAIAAEPPDVLISFGYPMTDHLLGLDLRLATGLPWLVHFSDPWADSLFRPRSELARRINARKEARVIARADRVLFTSARTLDMVMGKYPLAWRAKAAVVPHAWDMDHFGPEPEPRAESVPGPVRDSRRVIRHIGNLYGARSPEPLFKALATMMKREPDDLAGVRFELVGSMSSSFLASDAYKSLPPHLVSVRRPVRYAESLRLASDADALLVIDAPSESPSVFLPSKLVEYIGARRPVWGISPPGTSADLIAEWAGSSEACADPADVEGVIRMLRTGLAGLEAGTAGPGPDEVAQRFAPEAVAAALREQAEQAIHRSRSRDGAG